MEKIKIGIIFGGRSGEHEISIRSAKTVIEQIDREKFDVVPIAISKKGVWLNPSESLTLLPENVRKSFSKTSENFRDVKIALLGDTEYQGLTRLESSETEKTFAPLDVVFPVLHGTFGEDGTIQGMFEMADIPYVGCGVLASSCGMDKVVMKTLFRDAELLMCKYVWFLRSEWERDNNAVIKKIETKFGYPCFVKPANLGSSVGVSKAFDEESLKKAIALAAEYDRKIIVEEGLDAREIECAVIGNDDAKASLPGEYIIHDESKKFLDYTEKYTGTGNNEFVVPAVISEELTGKIQQVAVNAFRAIDGSGLARVDFFLRNDTGALLINEINTLPGLTDASGFPKMWKGTGIEFSKLIEILVEAAFDRHKDKSRNKTIK
ncbi:MAG: D-alanine--D-alanine ligase [Acidobacteriota bacterium]|jgi:D-alanine-D-alanine ligase|nr:D-alanine--D-alanine ligase [Acidobacteriota bacterium]MDQ3372290.1 D-alanine--D-alanine ligase [Acidobacteriota bacterium]